MIKWNSWFMGIFTGLALPAVVYFGGKWLIATQGKGFAPSFDESFSLFAFALNGGFMYFMNRKGMDKFGMGVIAATFVYIFIWVFKFQV